MIAPDRTECYKQSMTTQFESSEAAILSRVIHPDSGDWPHAAAEAILSIGFNETDRERMTALLEKTKAGDLTLEESEALEHYRHIGKATGINEVPRPAFLTIFSRMKGRV